MSAGPQHDPPQAAQTAAALDRWIQYLYVAHRYPRMAVIAQKLAALTTD